MKFAIKITVIVSFLTLLFLGFSSAGNAFLKGDIDEDGKIGLAESINALQVSAGMRTATAVKTINVPGNFNTIQEAIDAAASGDTVNIAAGTYNESLSISKDKITLQGAGKDATIIKGNGTNNTISISNARGKKRL